ncbi:hypothetical protein HMPREF9420_1875 [Segatella salivae DSM 15606]|uniref:Uncharacterized protein n=1 Tax=Segatella salivae DSM 15606 TaxID=888832 RepID=E6MQV7_9BACT|nr:hypothetical protein HMPREF9420_1875 [Segatella salivae DSM 15606]
MLFQIDFCCKITTKRMDYKIKGIRKGAKEWQTLHGLHFSYEMI